MTRRPGLTLTEVLVTLGILAFGVLAILTLFPLSASQMAIAAREDRSAQAAFAADGFLRAYWKSEVVEKGGGTESFFDALDDPDGPKDPNQPANGLPRANPEDVSYPVVLDPMGYWARNGRVNRDWLGDAYGGANRNTSVPRCNLQLSNSAQYAFRLCSMLDGLGYDEDGRPQTDREVRYNFLWVVQRPLNANRYNANLTVVVFDNRPNLYAPLNSEGESVHTTPNNGVVPNSTSLTLNDNPTTGAPDLKPGNWIMDVTTDTSINPATNKPYAVRHANFYQIVSVNTPSTDPTVAAGTTVLQLQSPLKRSTDPRYNAPSGTYTGTFVVLRGVTGVYTKPQLSAQ